MEKIMIGLIGAIIALLLKHIYDSWKIALKMNAQRKLMLDFIDDIILKCIKINLEEYDKVLQFTMDLKTVKISETPMLNKNIFEFFDKEVIVKLFKDSKENRFSLIYSNLYEFDFLRDVAPDRIMKEINDFFKTRVKNSLKDSLIEDNIENRLLEHVETCKACKDELSTFKENIEIQKEHYLELIKSFNEVKDYLNSKKEWKWKVYYFFNELF